MIFIDSSFFIAIVNKNDNWHNDSVKIAKRIADSEKIVSNLIISEVITSINTLLGGKLAKLIYDNIKDNYTIVNENRNLYDNSIFKLINFDGTLSFTDCLSLQIMQEMGINQIVSFDSDFDKINKIKRIYR